MMKVAFDVDDTLIIPSVAISRSEWNKTKREQP